jgi:hypothetical protein
MQMLDVLSILIGTQVVIFLLYLNWQIAGALWRWLDQHVFFKIRNIRMIEIKDNKGNRYLFSKDAWGNVISIQRIPDDVYLQENNSTTETRGEE